MTMVWKGEPKGKSREGCGLFQGRQLQCSWHLLAGRAAYLAVRVRVKPVLYVINQGAGTLAQQSLSMSMLKPWQRWPGPVKVGEAARAALGACHRAWEGSGHAELLSRVNVKRPVGRKALPRGVWQNQRTWGQGLPELPCLERKSIATPSWRTLVLVLRCPFSERNN